MTTGILTAKNDENRLKASNVVPEGNGWSAVIHNDEFPRWFSQKYWDFTEDKPSPAEKYKVLEPGTIFVINRPESPYKYVKISDEKYYSAGFDRVRPVTTNAFPEDLYVIERAVAIRKGDTNA